MALPFVVAAFVVVEVPLPEETHHLGLNLLLRLMMTRELQVRQMSPKLAHAVADEAAFAEHVDPFLHTEVDNVLQDIGGSSLASCLPRKIHSA